MSDYYVKTFDELKKRLTVENITDRTKYYEMSEETQIVLGYLNYLRYFERRIIKIIDTINDKKSDFYNCIEDNISLMRDNSEIKDDDIINIKVNTWLNRYRNNCKKFINEVDLLEGILENSEFYDHLLDITIEFSNEVMISENKYDNLLERIESIIRPDYCDNSFNIESEDYKERDKYFSFEPKIDIFKNENKLVISVEVDFMDFTSSYNFETLFKKYRTSENDDKLKDEFEANIVNAVEQIIKDIDKSNKNIDYKE